MVCFDQPREISYDRLTAFLDKQALFLLSIVYLSCSSLTLSFSLPVCLSYALLAFFFFCRMHSPSLPHFFSHILSLFNFTSLSSVLLPEGKKIKSDKKKTKKKQEDKPRKVKRCSANKGNVYYIGVYHNSWENKMRQKPAWETKFTIGGACEKSSQAKEKKKEKHRKKFAHRCSGPRKKKEARLAARKKVRM
jgi:hypothetical protein